MQNNSNNKRKHESESKQESKKRQTTEEEKEKEREHCIELLKGMFNGSKREREAVEFISLREFKHEGQDCERAVAFFNSRDTFSNFDQIVGLVASLYATGNAHALKRQYEFIATEEYKRKYSSADLRNICFYALQCVQSYELPALSMCEIEDLTSYIVGHDDDRIGYFTKDAMLCDAIQHFSKSVFKVLCEKYKLSETTGYLTYFIRAIDRMLCFTRSIILRKSSTRGPPVVVCNHPNGPSDAISREYKEMRSNGITLPISFLVQGSRMLIDYLADKHSMHNLFNKLWCMDRGVWGSLITRRVSPCDLTSRLFNCRDKNINMTGVSLVAEYINKFDICWRAIYRYFDGRFDADGEIRTLIFSFVDRTD